MAELQSLETAEFQAMKNMNDHVNDADSTPPRSLDEKLPAKGSAWRNLFIWATIALAPFCVFLDEGIIATAIPIITNRFDSLGDIGWYGSAYNITLSSLQLLYGRLYSEFPIKVVFLASLGVFEVGSLICATSPNSIAFIIGRAIAGWGASGITSGVLVLISAVLPAKNLPMYIGGMGIVYGCGAILGPIIGGALTEISSSSWRWCFYINLILAGPTLVAAIFFVEVPDKPATQNPASNRSFGQKLLSLDPVGLVLLVPWVTSFILALQFGSVQYSWGDYRTIVCFVVAGVLFVAFWLEQWWVGEKALVPPRLLKMRVVAFSAIYALTIDSTFYTLVYYVPLWFQAIKGVSPADSGVRYFAFAIPLVLAVFAGGIGVTKLGYYQPFMLASTILSSIGAGLLTTLTVHSGADRWIPFLLIAGIGVGLGEQQPAIAVQSTIDPVDVPIGVAFILFIQSFGPTVFITVAQAVFYNVLQSKLTQQLPGLSSATIKSAGATEIQNLVSPQDRHLVLEIYNSALTKTYLVTTVMACATVFGLAGIGLNKIRHEEEPKNESEEVDEKAES